MLASLAIVLGHVANSAWTPTGELVSMSSAVNFAISVQQQNLYQLKANALAVSTPGHPRYGKFMTKQQIDALTAPHEADMKTVTSWLDSNQISYTVSNEIVSVSTTVSAAAKLLDTSFFRVSHLDHGTKTISGEFTLPRGVRSSVAGVFGLRGLPLPKRTDLKGNADVEKVTPSVIASTYSISGVTVKRGSGNTQAVAEFQGQYMSKEDLSTFFTNEVPTAKAGDDAVSKFVGVDYQKGEGVEVCPARTHNPRLFTRRASERDQRSSRSWH